MTFALSLGSFAKPIIDLRGCRRWALRGEVIKMQKTAALTLSFVTKFLRQQAASFLEALLVFR